jgi:hypothetical protein
MYAYLGDIFGACDELCAPIVVSTPLAAVDIRTLLQVCNYILVSTRSAQRRAVLQSRRSVHLVDTRRCTTDATCVITTTSNDMHCDHVYRHDGDVCQCAHRDCKVYSDIQCSVTCIGALFHISGWYLFFLLSEMFSDWHIV